MEALLKQRSILKGKMTRLETYITSLPDQNNADLTTLNVKIEQLNECAKRFETLHEEILTLCNEEEWEAHETDVTDFEKRHTTALSTLLDIKRASSPSPPTTPSPSTNTSSSADPTPSTSSQASAAPATVQHVKLPRLELPTFNGDLKQWLTFQNLFSSTVHKNTSLSGAQKLQYLMSSLRDEAFGLLQSMQISDANYEEAWELLNKRYQNKREIVQSHLKRLFNQQSISSKSSDALRKLLDHTTQCIRSLKILELPTQHWDTIFIFIVAGKLDPESRELWELTLKGDDLPTWDDFSDFLDQRARALAAVGTKGKTSSQPQAKQSKGSAATTSKSTTVHLGATQTTVCVACSADHALYKCPEFLKLSIANRTQMVKEKHLCFNCLAKGHSASNCTGGTCKLCKKKHNTLLHINYQQQNNAEQPATPVATHYSSSKSETMLSTIQLHINDKFGNKHQVRALLDNGAQCSFITERWVQRCGLPKKRTHMPVTVLGAASSKSVTATARCQLSSAITGANLDIDALVVPVITTTLPHFKIDQSKWEGMNHLPLADPTFGEPGPIDLLLGSDVFVNLIRDGIRQSTVSQPGAFNTIFGWVISGKTQSQAPASVNVHLAQCDVIEDFQRFWEVEDVAPATPILTAEEKACEEHFAATHSRDDSGRYTIRLPFKPNKKTLGESKSQAISRWKQMERRFLRNPELMKLYFAVLQEYIDLGHMQRIPPSEIDKDVSQICYIPHHAVVKESSSTTKLRIVFDGSARTSTGVSLNDTLMVGPKLQDDLFLNLLRLRCHPILIKGDIPKMYRQFAMHPEDCDYQRIVFRRSPNDPIEEYRLLTATFGTASAPYLAIKCLQQLAIDEQHDFPNASKVVLRDFYVDDVVTGENTQTKAIKLKDQLSQLMQRGTLDLRKWSSNGADVLESVDPNWRETDGPLSLDSDDSVKTLGLYWNPGKDCLSYKVNLSVWTQDVTMRILLSDTGKMFDPTGLLAPAIIIAKMLFQDLWKLKCGWDDILPQPIMESWKAFRDDLCAVENLAIPRCVTYSTDQPLQLFGFCDASEKAYAAAVYTRCTDGNGCVKVQLLTAKTKVAPTKQQTLPRLELCAAALLARLIETVKLSLEKLMQINDVICFSDSTIVLAWLASPPQRWKTFVANRVCQIQNVVPSSNWFHVKSEENPADCASRGIAPSALLTHTLWWNGPTWLPTFDKTEVMPPQLNDEIPDERKTIVISHIQVDTSLITKYSSLSKLQRVTALCRRFLFNAKLKESTSRKQGPMTIPELDEALMHLIKMIQQQEFNTEVQLLTKNKQLSSKSKILALSPFLDSRGLLRVGGRLGNAAVTLDKKHPILLPRSHPLTTLIIDHYHKSHLHAGKQLLLAALQQKYWIIRGSDAVRHYIHKCVTCHRHKATLSKQMMADLPTPRVNQSRPFLKCGVDYAGPFTLRVLKGRGHAKFKAYICLFVCFATRAIHLELVSDLSTTAFLAALRRFVSRRGKCTDIYSDCGTNFVGANKELKDFLKLTKDIQHNETVSKYLAEDGTKWHFNPPSAPHFGGLWEAGIKSVKFHFKRVVGNAELNFEEMSTLLTQIEACLNSRPLTAMSTDPNDEAALTPGHFLIGHPLTAIPEPNYTTTKENRLTRWQFTSRLFQHFWQRWSKEYLSRLQQRPKWTIPQPNMTIGALVLIKDDNLPPLKWNLGRVTELHPGKDGLVRTVSVKTKGDILKRPVAKLSLLPLDTGE